MESLIKLVETELSEQTLNALREFYREEAGKRLISADSNTVEEDWELSQFWYDEKTAETLSNIALKAAGENGSIACVSSPTVFATLWKRKENFKAKLFEYDKRFQDLYGEYFIFYDYNKPLNIPEEMKSAFDVVIVDPPYLSKECLEKTAQTVKLLSKQYIILCTV